MSDPSPDSERRLPTKPFSPLASIDDVIECGAHIAAIARISVGALSEWTTSGRVGRKLEDKRNLGGRAPGESFDETIDQHRNCADDNAAPAMMMVMVPTEA